MSTTTDINQEIIEARKKFSEMYVNLKLGGKGKKFIINFINYFIFKVPKKEKKWYLIKTVQFKIRRLAV
jgi:hypothetical protein